MLAGPDRRRNHFVVADPTCDRFHYEQANHDLRQAHYRFYGRNVSLSFNEHLNKGGERNCFFGVGTAIFLFYHIG